MIKNLVLDIGNVICEWNPARLSRSVTDIPAHQNEIMDVTIKHPDWLELDKGAITVEQAIANAAQRTQLDKSRVAGIYQNLPGSMWLIESTAHAMYRAADAGVPIYILSNMQQHTWEYLRKTHACFSVCTGVVVSCDIGIIKPDPRIYQHLCDQFSLEPSECIFIDDMPENIEAARQCGWQGEQLTSIDDNGQLLNAVLDRIIGS